MRVRIYLSFFILCCIFSQGISFLSEENNDLEKSTNLHVRKKRLLDKTPGGDQPVPIERVPYIVSINVNKKQQCAGSILSPNIIITAAHCGGIRGTYDVYSGSSYENRGTPHYITGAHFFPSYNVSRPDTHDFVLLTIYPFINFQHSPNRPIKLQTKELLLDTVGTVSGWGSNKESPHRTSSGYLRSITLPLIARMMCQQYYHNRVIIDEKKFCTLDLCDQKACGSGDSGNPFVVDGYLAGIHSGSLKGTNNNGRSPDVFMNLCDREYKEWIHAQIALHPPNEHVPHIPLIRINGNPHLQHHPANPHNHHNNIN